MTGLVLGPLLRHVDETSATLWVETSEATTVAVTAGEQRAEARTFAVHGHHYALVVLDGLTKGSRTTYQVHLDGAQSWPETDSPFPPPVIATLDHEKPLRMAFGSCRTSVPHDETGNKSHGVDALRAYALRMARVTDPAHEEDPDPDDEARWPDLVLFLGDQVYADQTSDEMQEFIRSRRDIDQPPGTELKDYEEYARLYKIAWGDPVNRWLLSTLPSAMIFDDHDIRDDWNTSHAWKQEMEATTWWHGRIVAGLASYWVHQHLGNLGREERDADDIWQRIAGHDGDDEYDASELLDDLADRADQDPDCYRWSFARQFGTQARLVVVDSRAARVLEESRREILDEKEMGWFDDQMRGDVDHLLVGTSLPFLLSPGLHYVEAFSEALTKERWGTRTRKTGERMRQGLDLEHWAAFQDAFQEAARMTLEVARGERGRAPRTVIYLSGDVHHSYVSEARPTRRERRSRGGAQSHIIQAVCSPIRNPMRRRMRFLVAVLAYGVAGPVGHVVARSAKVSRSPLKWNLLKGPWFDNSLATLEVTPSGLRMWWATGKVEDGAHDRPRLARVAEVTVPPA